MSVEERWTEVVVTRDPDGSVRIAPVPRPADPATAADEVYQASLDVAGGILTVDVRRPTEAPTAMLDDPALAQAWLLSVYGPRVAAEVVKYVDDSSHDAQWRYFAERDHASDLVGRLGTEFWLHRWWPADYVGLGRLDEDLLEIEIAGLATLAETLFVDAEPVRHLLSPHAALAADQVRRLVELDPEDVSGAELRVFAAALRAVVDLVPDHAPGYAACLELAADPRLQALERRGTAGRVAGAPWLRSLAERLSSLTSAARARADARRGDLGYAGVRGEDLSIAADDTPFELRAVDWSQVPPRVVSMREPFANLAHRVVGEGSASVVEVVVPAASDYDDDRGDVLYARAYDRLRVPVTFPLEFRRESADAAGVFVGSRRLYSPPQGPVVVDVYSPDFVSRPRLTDEAGNVAAAEILARVAFLKSRSDLPSADVSLTEQAMRVAGQA